MSGTSDVRTKWAAALTALFALAVLVFAVIVLVNTIPQLGAEGLGGAVAPLWVAVGILIAALAICIGIPVPGILRGTSKRVATVMVLIAIVLVLTIGFLAAGGISIMEALIPSLALILVGVVAIVLLWAERASARPTGDQA